MSPALRSSANAEASAEVERAAMPIFINYADYDFRNEQSLLLLEDLLWESPYSTFGFYDYLTLADTCRKGDERVPVLSEAVDLGVAEDLGSVPSIVDLGDAPAVNIQSDDTLISPARSSRAETELLALSSDLTDFDDQYQSLKAQGGRSSS